MGEFSPALFLLFMGMGFSLFVMGAEYVYYLQTHVDTDEEDEQSEEIAEKPVEQIDPVETIEYNASSA